MTSESTLLKCHICGRFIALIDFDSNKAVSKVVAVDSDYSTEEILLTCEKCLTEKEAE